MSVVSELKWLDSHNAWLVVTFGCFVVTIILFAVLYFLVYVSDRSNFTFGADVQKAQIVKLRQTLIKNLERLETILTILQETMTGVGVRVTTDEDGDTICDLHSGLGWRIGRIPETPSPGGSIGPDYFMVFYNPEGKVFHREEMKPEHHGEPILACTVVRSRIQEKKIEINEQLASLTTSTPNIWSFWDFLYFSTTTQTTVGYGDILPNSTIVRVFVIFQILIGYGLLIVVLNLVLRPH